MVEASLKLARTKEVTVGIRSLHLTEVQCSPMLLLYLEPKAVGWTSLVDHELSLLNRLGQCVRTQRRIASESFNN